MKKLLSLLIGLTALGNVFAVTAQPISSAQAGFTPVLNYILQTNGATSTWVATSSLGFLNFGTTTIRSLFSATAPVTYNSGTGVIACTTASSGVAGCLSSTSFDIFNNKLGTTSAGTLFPTFAYASSTFASTSWVTSTFPTYTYASSTYYFASNPSGFITNSVSNLTNYPSYTYASSTYIPFSYASSTFVTFPYASSTFPTFSYASSTYGILNASNGWTGSVNSFLGATFSNATSSVFIFTSATGTSLRTTQETTTNLAFTNATGTSLSFTNATGTILSLTNGTSSSWFSTNLAGTNVYPNVTGGSFLATDLTGKIIATTSPITLASLSATYPIQYNSSTGVISTGFSTSTINVFSLLNTFNGGAVLNNATATSFGFTSATGTNLSATNLNGTAFVYTNGTTTSFGTTNITSTNATTTNLTFTGITGSFLATDLTGKVIATTSPSGASLSGGSNGFITRWLSPTTVGTGISLDNGTVAGVNATNTNYTFNIQSTSGKNALQVSSSSGTSYLQIDNTGVANFAQNVSLVTGKTLAVENVSAQAISNTSDLNLVGGGASGNIIFTVNGERMRVTTAGNVAIATTTALDKLTVQGNVAPSQDILYGLGSSTLRWLNLYAQNVFATSSVITNSTSTTIFGTNVYPNITGGSFVATDLNGKLIATTSPSAGTTYTGTYPIIVTGSVISSGFSTSTINVFSALNTFNGGAVINNATATSFGFTSATGTSLFSTQGTYTNLIWTNATGTALSFTNATGSTLSFTNATGSSIFATNGSFTNGSITNGTSTNYFTTNSSSTNSTSTNLFGLFGFFNNSTSTNFFSTNAAFTGATSTNLNLTNILSMGGTTVLNSSRDLLNIATYTGGTINGQTISNTANFTGSVNVTGGTTLSNATSSNFFTTNASSTNATSSNFFAQNATTTNLGFTNLTNSALVGSWLATDLAGKVVATTTFPAATISGGNNGFLARWTSTSALSTGLFRDNGTVAGVNATTSTSTLFIQGNPGGSNILSVSSSTGQAPFFSVGSGGTTTATNLISTNATTTAFSFTNATGSVFSFTSATGTNLSATNLNGTALTFTSGTTTNFGFTNLTNPAILGSFLATDLFGKVIATTSPALGSGTNGKVARWTSAGFLSTGIFLDNGTVAGVNATTSTSTFLIQGNIGTDAFNVASSSGSSIFLVNKNHKMGLGTTTFDVTVPTQTPYFSVDTGSTTYNTGINVSGWVNDFLQVNIQNMSTSTRAESGFSATANNGTLTTGFAWMGINGSAFNTTSSYSSGVANDVSYIGSGNDMYITNASTTGKLFFQLGGTGTSTSVNTKFTMTPGGFFGVATTSPSNAITVATGSILVSEFLPASTSTAMTLDVRNSNQTIIRYGVSNVVISFTNYQGGMTWRVITCAPPSGTPGTIFFATTTPGITWTGGTLPASTATAKKCDVWAFIATAGTSTTVASPVIFGAQNANF